MSNGTSTSRLVAVGVFGLILASVAGCNANKGSSTSQPDSKQPLQERVLGGQPEWVSIHPSLLGPGDIHMVVVQLHQATTQNGTAYIKYCYTNAQGGLVAEDFTNPVVFDNAAIGTGPNACPDRVAIPAGTVSFAFPVKIKSSLTHSVEARVQVGVNIEPTHCDGAAAQTFRFMVRRDYAPFHVTGKLPEKKPQP